MAPALTLPASPVVILLVLVALALLLTGCVAAIDARAAARETRWEAAHPPLGQLIGPPGRRVHVLEAGQPRGSAPDLVLIHGANGNLRDFTYDLVGRLADDYRILVVDRPGLGWSDSHGPADSDPRVQARILRNALAGLGLNRPVVLGHSYGGAVAMGWALEAPGDTAALVLLAGATHPWDGALGLWYRINDGPLGGFGRRSLSAFAPEGITGRIFASVFAPDPVPAGYPQHFGAGLSLRRASQAVNTRQVNALLGHLRQMAPQYPALNLPIEAVHGDADTVVGLNIHARRLVQDVASARLTVIENGGHMPHHGHPGTVVAAIHRAAERAGLR